MNVGVCTISSKERSPEAVIDLVAGVGGAGVEVWGKGHVEDAAQCRELAGYASDRGIEIPVFGSYLRPGGDAFEADMHREIELAEALGADLIRVWAGSTEYQEADRAEYEGVVADLRTLAEALDGTGIDVTVERHAGTVTNTTAGAAAVIADTPTNVGLNWQPNFAQAATEIETDIRELADVTNNVHLQTRHDPSAGGRAPLAFSYFDVAGVIDELAAAGYDGYLEVEFVTEGARYGPTVAADVAFIQQAVVEAAESG